MEEVANQLGLQAEQLLLPVDHLFAPEAKALPALVVVVLPDGVTHFVVVWRRHGDFLQVMDPAVGRRWVSRQRFEGEIYRHAMTAAADNWREFAASAGSQALLNGRLKRLGVAKSSRKTQLDRALADESWRSLAALDAAIRLIQSLGARRTGALRLLDSFFQQSGPDSGALLGDTSYRRRR